MWWKIGKWIAYPLFFVFVLVTTVSWTFPSATLSPYIKSKMEEALFAQSGNVQRPGNVQIGEASLWRVTGADMRRVTIQEASRYGEESPKWNIDRLQVRLGLWGLLFGRPTVVVNSDFYGASASGKFRFSNTKQLSDFWLTVDSLDLSKMTMLSAKLFGLQLKGIASLAIDFDAGASVSQNASGSISLAVDNFGLSNPATNKQGRLEAEFDIVKGTAKSKKFKATGGDIEADLNVAAKIEKQFGFSRLDGGGWFKFSEAYYPQIKPILFVWNRSHESLKAPDGKYYMRVGGSLGQPSANLVTKDAIDNKGSNNPLRNMRTR